ncbi:MAG: ATP-binding cassette domain-containing protein [Solirubrobacterales bacterium]|nr:ATP-binding cassette domain-containing protein [Solirubrobacterales bacterium]
MLRIRGLEAGYEDLPVLHGVDLEVNGGEVVALVGANGAGKTTLLRAMSGLIRPSGGAVEFDGQPIAGEPAHDAVARGLILVPEGRRLFPFLSVGENLTLGAYGRSVRRDRARTMADVLELFPALADRRDQLAGSLSGGEQQMCALARGLMSKPKLIALDEPSLGLAPIIVDQLFGLIRTLADTGLTVLLVEQNVGEALEMAGRGYVLEQGRVTMTGSGEELFGDERLRSAYLGL